MKYGWIRSVFFWALQLWWVLFRKFIRKEVIFVVYPGSDTDYKGYFPKWMRALLPRVFPIGFVGKNGLVMATANSTQELEAHPFRLNELLDGLHKIAAMLHVQSVALAGRLPSVMFRHGLVLEPPFVNGAIGTIFACDTTVRAVVREKGWKDADLTIGVLGVGWIGSQLINHWASNGYKAIVGVDRVERETPTNSKVTITTDLTALREVDILVVLVEEGHQLEAAIGHLKPECVVLDDTHPQLPSAIRRLLQASGIQTFKVAVRNHARFWPRLPGFREDWLPGCLIEALVVARNGGWLVLDQDGFAQDATQLGLRAIRVEHHYENKTK